jgi:L-ribulokinase
VGGTDVIERFALGLDFGTESGRVMLVRLSDGEEAAWSVVPYAHGVLDRALPDGAALSHDWALQHPQDYIAVLERGIPEVLASSGVSPEQIIGIGVDFTSCTILPALSDGTPLCVLPRYAANPHAWVKLWKHHAAQPQAERINAIAGARNEPVMRAYNGRYSSEWFFSKVLEIVEKAPEIYDAAGRILEAGDWLVWQLTGAERRSECAAGYKGMWVKGRGFPGRDFFAALDPRLEDVVEQKLTTAFLPLGARAGGLTEDMARRTGLRAGTPVASAIIDAHAAVPGCGVVKPGTLCMIMGTSACHMLLASEQRFVEGVAGVVEDGIVPGSWGYEAGQAAVGDIYAWFFRAFGSQPAAVTGQAARLQPGASGLIALDWWNGNRSVLMDAGLTGAIVGLTLDTRPEEIYRALIEATAFGTYTIIRAFEKEGIPIDRLVACGGIAEKSPLVMQIFADVTNRVIHLPRSVQASGLGAAMHGAIAAGAYRSFEEAAAAMAGLQSHAYTPDPSAHAIYERLYVEYMDLHDYFGRGTSAAMKRLKAMRAAAAI